MVLFAAKKAERGNGDKARRETRRQDGHWSFIAKCQSGRKTARIRGIKDARTHKLELERRSNLRGTHTTNV